MSMAMNHLREAAASTCQTIISGHNLRADCQRRTLDPPFSRVANATPVSVEALSGSVTILPCEGKRQYLLTLQVRRYCLLPL